MYRNPNTVTIIKARYLEWAGHLVRQSDDRTTKKVFLCKLNDRRTAGRPKLRQLDCTENDLKLMGVKRLRKKAEDSFALAIILKKALVQLKGPYANEEKE
jgi:hypothetical protein